MLPGMKKNADADKESNWLPAPNDLIYLVMRLYWPKATPPSILRIRLTNPIWWTSPDFAQLGE